MQKISMQKKNCEFKYHICKLSPPNYDLYKMCTCEKENCKNPHDEEQITQNLVTRTFQQIVLSRDNTIFPNGTFFRIVFDKLSNWYKDIGQDYRHERRKGDSIWLVDTDPDQKDFQELLAIWNSLAWQDGHLVEIHRLFKDKEYKNTLLFEKIVRYLYSRTMTCYDPKCIFGVNCLKGVHYTTLGKWFSGPNQYNQKLLDCDAIFNEIIKSCYDRISLDFITNKKSSTDLDNEEETAKSDTVKLVGKFNDLIDERIKILDEMRGNQNDPELESNIRNVNSKIESTIIALDSLIIPNYLREFPSIFKSNRVQSCSNLGTINEKKESDESLVQSYNSPKKSDESLKKCKSWAEICKR